VPTDAVSESRPGGVSLSEGGADGAGAVTGKRCGREDRAQRIRDAEEQNVHLSLSAADVGSVAFLSAAWNSRDISMPAAIRVLPTVAPVACVAAPLAASLSARAVSARSGRGAIEFAAKTKPAFLSLRAAGASYSMTRASRYVHASDADTTSM